MKLPDKPKRSNRRRKRGSGLVPLKPMTLASYSNWLVHVDPSEMLSADNLQLDMRSLRTPFTHRYFRFPLNCATCLARPPQTCRVILDQLADLNEWFWLLATEIREVEPGLLAFTDLDEEEMYGGDPGLLRLATVLLHCLLTRHRCLKVLAGLRNVLPREHRLLCDGIRHSTTLTALRLKGCQLQSHQVRGLVTAIRRMGRLEEFSWDHCTFKGTLRSAQDAFAAYITSTTSLSTFRMTYVPLFANPRTLIGALDKNESIRALHLDSSYMSVGVGEAFHKYLRKNKTVAELTLVRDVFQWSPNVDELFRSLMVNVMLERLSLEHFEMDAVTAMKFARVFHRPGSRLREASFLFCDYWDFVQLSSAQKLEQHWEIHSLVSQMGPAWRTLPFMRAAGGRSRLTRLTLHAGPNDVESWQLLAAADQTRCLEQLRFDAVSEDALKPVDAGHEAGMSVKVSLDEGDRASVYFLATHWDRYGLDGRVEHEGNYRFYDTNTLTFREVCMVLPRYDIITTLQLQVDAWKDNCFKDSATTIAHFASHTKQLKELCLQFSVCEQSAHIIIQGLSNNKTIEKLCIENWSVSNEDIDVLCRWVAASKTVYHLVYNCNSYRSSQALLERAEEFLSHSYGLTYMHIMDYGPFFKSWLNVKNFLRRNKALVDCAAHCVLGRHVKRAAAALERVSWHPQLAYSLKNMTSLSMSEVKQKIKTSLKQVQMSFWQMSGVVKEELTCYERHDGQKQIDNLGIDVWLLIRSYLNVGDVLDSKVPKKRPRKRRRC